MYLDASLTRRKGKTYSRVLLRESYREAGKVKHRTIANLSKCSPEEIAAIKLAFEHKHDLEALTRSSPSRQEDFTLRQGLSVGAVGILHGLAAELGITRALGSDRQGKLALWQVIARVIDQGSRLSAVRLAGAHACCDLLGLDAFNEDHLYQNLAWLTDNQREIETRLFEQAYPDKKPPIFLYDVTSSYLEGKHNVLGAFGYNRDGKRGKMQIVIGLLCDGQGVPLAIEVFAGNTLDPKTMASQIEKVAADFGGGEVTFVGDRGMIKSAQIQELGGRGFHYITAITKPQIETLLKKKVIQMELFEQSLAEVSEQDVRYILRRNPQRAQETEACRQSKLRRLQEKMLEANVYLEAHPRAAVGAALSKLRTQIEKLKVGAWISVKQAGEKRLIELDIDEAERAEQARLDGCYVIKTDLKVKQASKELVHERYKDLSLVEQAFRTSKTVELDLRPIHVRLEASTRGHVLVVMLAYRLVQELGRRWVSLDITVEEGIRQLSTLCLTEVSSGGEVRCNAIPEPRPEVAELVKLSGIALPQVIRSRGAKVATKKKLPSTRTRRSK
jgi:transposase